VDDPDRLPDWLAPPVPDPPDRPPCPDAPADDGRRPDLDHLLDHTERGRTERDQPD
jgi:hypothetical protein